MFYVPTFERFGIEGEGGVLSIGSTVSLTPINRKKVHLVTPKKKNLLKIQKM